MSDEQNLVPGRDCGECTECCVRLRIDTEELQKKAEISCEHRVETKGCGIYETRPPVCRSWYCGWRLMDFLDDSWRPDRSQILIRLDGKRIVLDAKKSIRVYFSDEVLKLIGALIEAGITVAVSINGKPGHTAATMELNTALAEAVKARNKEAVMEGVLKALEFGANFATDPIGPFTYPLKRID